MALWKPTPGDAKQRINEQIRISPVRVIGADGTQLGILPLEKAMETARTVQLDLVEVAPNDRPPVCRIMDFGKYKYQQKKRQHKGHSHQVKIKEIRVRPKTGDHDLNVKVNKAREFLTHKDKVIVSVVFRGRELAHIEEGRKILNDVLQDRGAARAPRPPDGLHAGAEVNHLQSNSV
jgi:translation initiation factor IF-3